MRVSIIEHKVERVESATRNVCGEGISWFHILVLMIGKMYVWTSRPWSAILGDKELVGGTKTGVCILSALLPIAIFMDLTLCLSDSALSTASPGKIAQNKPSASAFSLCIKLSLPSHGHIPFLIWDSMSLSQSSLFLWCLLLVSPSCCFCGLSVFCVAEC